jgi:hypothetical protein
MAISKGTAHIFGVDTYAGLTVTSFTLTKKPALEETVTDENGVTIHLRMDDVQTEVTIEGFIPGSGAPTFTIGNSLAYKGVAAILKETEHRGEAKGFQKFSLKGTAYQEFT